VRGTAYKTDLAQLRIRQSDGTQVNGVPAAATPCPSDDRLHAVAGSSLA
jgi:hypothetical protein